MHTLRYESILKTKALTKKECKKKFMELSCALSPENLCCDGGLSRAQVDLKLKTIYKAWYHLEKLYGREVSELETFEW